MRRVSLLSMILALSLLAAPAFAQTPALEVLWSFPIASPAVTAPAVADLDGRMEKTPAGEVYLKHPEILFGTANGRVMAFTHDQKQLPGWPVDPDKSAPLGIAVADLDNKYEGPTPSDLGYHPEIVVATTKGALVAYDWHGAKLWSAKTEPVTRRPSIADVNGDGQLEVVSRTASSVVTLNGRTGESIRRIPLADSASTLELADLDGDGAAEVILSSPADGELRAMRADGTTLPGWPVKLAKPGAPIVADIDDDGAPEVIVPVQSAIAALKLDGTPVKGWPVALNGEASALAAGDVNRDGKIEIALVETRPANPARVFAFRGDGKPAAGFPATLANTGSATAFELTIAPIADEAAPAIEIVARAAQESRLFALRGSDSKPLLTMLRKESAPGIALFAEQSRTFIALPSGNRLIVFAAPEGSAKPWAFDWPMENRTAESNRALGFPILLADQAAASPISVDLDGDGRKEILIGTADSSGRQGARNDLVYAVRSNGTFATGWPIRVPEDARSLAAGDINGPAYPRVVLAGWDGVLRAWSGDGKDLWTPVVPPDKPRHLGGVALADINGDGQSEILFGALKSGDQGRIYAYSGGGKLLWQYPESPSAFTMPATSTPAVGDLDGDGKPEIAITTRSYVDDKGKLLPARLIVLKADGKLLWGDDDAHSVAGDIFASPLIADLKGDGKREVVFGSAGYIDADGKVRTDGKLYVYDPDGKPMAGWPHALSEYGEPRGWIYATPAIGDVDFDGKPEIAAGSAGTYSFDPAKGYGYNNGGSKVYLWKADGTLAPRWPYDAGEPIYGAPLIADVNGDKLPEVVVGTGGDAWNTGILHGQILALDARVNNLPGWPKMVTERQVGTSSFESRPLLTDPWLYAGSSTLNNAYDAAGAKQGVGRLYRFRGR